MNLPSHFFGFVQTEIFTTLSLGFILGLKHALDADHLIAVSTIISQRKGILSSSVVGAMWGVGHTVSLLLIGCFVVSLQLQIPERVALVMELGVAAMLVILGINVLWKLSKGEMFHLHVHKHHGHQHLHPHSHPFKTPHEHSHEQSHHQKSSLFLQRLFRGITENKRSVLIGMVHGIAGSAALMLVVLATIRSTGLALLYIAVFGIGSIGGMMLMSTVIGLPFMVTASRSLKLNRIVQGIAGITSIVFGLFLVWQIGIAGGLFV